MHQSNHENVNNKRKQLASSLLQWYDEHHRDLPWRNTTDPYHIWVSEVMLQQTRVQTVLDYYARFTERFSTVNDLANASIDEVLRQWQGLGYYARARRMHDAANKIVKNHRGTIPQTYDELCALPGIGTYTAAAVASIAFGQPRAVVDGNVLRVASRVFAIFADVKRSATRNKVQTLLDELIPRERPGDFNQGMMELGAVVCIPASPRCESCPISHLCAGYESGVTEELPVRSTRSGKATHHFLVMAIKAGSAWLLERRPIDGLLGGLWQFPMIELSSQEWSRLVHQEGELNLKLRKMAEKHVDEQFGIDVLWNSRLDLAETEFSHLKWEVVLVTGTAINESAAEDRADYDGAQNAPQYVDEHRLQHIPQSAFQLRLMEAAKSSIQREEQAVES